MTLCPITRPLFFNARLVLLSLVALVWIDGCFVNDSATAQTPGPVSILESNESPKEITVRPLANWIESVEKRLADAESLLEKAKEAELAPAPAITRQVELLDRLELTLAQVATSESDAEAGAAKRNESQGKLEEFMLQGLPDTEATSFLLLDTTRDQLEEAKWRLKRLKEREKVALQELENARKEFRDLESARRLAKEALDESDGDAQRIPLNQKYVVAALAAEVAEATVRRREAELKSSRSAREAQELNLKLIEAKVQILAANARFDLVELNSQLQLMDHQAIELKNTLADTKGSETRRKYLEEQWMRTQRQIDASKGDKSDLQEELLAYQLGRSNLDEREEILKLALNRLEDSQKVWKRRQQLFSQRPAKEMLAEWKEENGRAISQLSGEHRAVNGKLEDLRNQLVSIEKKFNGVDDGSPLANWYAQQLTAVKGLIATQEENLRSIEAALHLQAKLERQLTTDSLTDTAKERLGEFWEKLEGIWNTELGSFEQPVTIQKVVKALFLFFAGFIIARLISRWLGRYLSGRMDASAVATVQSLSFYLLIVLFSLLALNVVRVPLTAFTVLGGAVALGIGFGSQNIINNFISGLILHAERPVKIGDLIQIGELFGNVEHIGARSTRIRTGENLEIIVPNSKFLQDNVVNFTLSSDKMRTSVTVGVAYGSPVIAVAQMLRRAVVETGRASKEPPPIVLFKNFGDNALEFEVHFWVRMRTMMDRRQIESAVRYQIVQLFAEEGITVAFPQRDVHLNTTTPLVVQMADRDLNLT